MWTRARFSNEYVPGLFVVARDSFQNKRAMSMWIKLCTVKTSQKAYEENAIRSGLGTLRPKGEGAGITYDTQIGGPKQTWVNETKALGVRITEEAIEDNLYHLSGGGEGAFKELFYDLGEAAEESIESDIARFFNSATATTYHSTRFGKAFAATNHNRLDGTTFSNYGTQTDLTYTSFWTNIVAAENTTGHRSQILTKKCKALWVPPQLEQKGLEILKSTDRPDTGNRATNAYAASGRKIQLMVWPHMTDTDMYVFQMDGSGIIFFWRRKTRFAKDKDFETGDMMVKVDQRYSAEIDDEMSFYFNVPA